MTPFYANYGMHPTTTNVPSIGQSDNTGRITRIHEARELAMGLLLEAQEQQKVIYDRRRNKEPIFSEGDKVYLSTENLITDEGSKKLSDLRTGPFAVLGKVGDGAYRLDLPDHIKVNPVFNVSLLTRANPDPIPGRAPSEPTPIIVDGHEEYEVEKLLASNWRNSHFQYKVSWKGYGKEHDGWLNCDDLLEDLGQESLEDYEKEFFELHPTARRHTSADRARTKGKRALKRK